MVSRIAPSVRSVVLGLALCVFLSDSARAEPYLVVTEGQSAQRVPAGAHLHAVDLDAQHVTKGILISERTFERPWMMTRSGNHLTGLGIGHRRGHFNDASTSYYPIEVSTAPLQATFPSIDNNRTLVAHFPGFDPDTGSTLNCMILRNEEGGILSYKVNDKRIDIPLAGTPVYATPGSDGTSAAVILRRPKSGDLAIQWCSLTGTRRISQAIPLPSSSGRYRVRIETSTLLGDGRLLALGLSGYSLDDATGEREAWVEVWDWEEQQSVGQAHQLEGIWMPNTVSLSADDGRSCWAITHTPGRSFAYATQLTVGKAHIETGQIFSFTGVNGPIHLAHSLETAGEMAIAVGQSILIYDTSLQRRDQYNFDSIVTAMHWSTDGLVAGLGNQLVQLNADGEPVKRVELATGRVVDIRPHPDAELYAQFPFALPVPRVVRQITFTENRIGHEEFSAGSALTRFDPTTLPSWIVPTKRPANNLGLSIDPLQFSTLKQVPDKTELRGYAPFNYNGDLYTLETRFQINVQTASAPAATLLWVRNPERISYPITSARNPFARLIHHLGAYPHLFLHEELAEPAQIDLGRFAGIILTSNDAEYGIFTRQELLDYVSQGGTLIYLARSDSNANDNESGRWLESMGIQRDPSQPVNGEFATQSAKGLLRHWGLVTIQNGSTLTVDNINSILVPGHTESQSAIMAQRTYGLGRVIVLASSTPLENKALADPGRLRFAEALFAWVRDTGSGLEDFDQDGIPDRVEDANRNGRRDPGESDFAKADTDNDGILDGLEDINQNGFVDDVETHPLLSDTDGDGLPDAADPQPLPPAGTPYIASVSPNTMPAEGSRSVIIEGRNFSPTSEIWFGTQKSPVTRVLNRTQLEAIVPPKPLNAPDTVSLEIRNADFTVSSSLDRGFRYGSRSSVPLTLRSLKTVREQYGIYTMHTQIFLPRSNIQIEHVSFVLENEPADALEMLKIVPGPFSSGKQSTPMNVTDLGNGRKLISVGNTGSFPRGVPLFDVQWRVNLLEQSSGTAHIRVVNKVLHTPHDGQVDSRQRTEMSYDFRVTPLIPRFDEQ